MLRVGVVMYQTSRSKGQELVAQRMVKAFRRLGFEAYLITSIYDDWNEAVEPGKVSASGGFVHFFDERLGIPVIRVDSYSPTWPPRRVFFRDFVATLKRLVEELKLNVLVTHSTLWNGPEEVVKFVEWKRQVAQKGSLQPPPLFCHMSHFQEPSDERYDLEERSYREAWNTVTLKQLFKVADVLLTVTPVETEEMVAMGAPREKCMLFPGGIEPPSVEGELLDVRGKYGLPRNSELVTTLGTVEERKNTMAVLEVARSFTRTGGVHFVIAGKAEGEYAERLKTQLSMVSNVSMLGEISEAEKDALILASTVNLIMSRSESLGLAQLEFMSAGIPVVTSGVGGQGWLVKNGVNGFVVAGPSDAAGAARAISRLLQGREFRKMSKEAAKFARRFDMTRLVHSLSKALMRAYEKSLGTTVEKLTPEERTIDSWAGDGKRVVATTHRLIFSSSRSLENSLSIPYDKIRRIRHVLRVPWTALAAGLGLTVGLLGVRIAHVPLDALLSGLSSAVPWSGWERLAEVAWAMPVAVASLVFLARMRREYLLEWEKGKMFIPSRFLRALQLADNFTATNLFLDEAQA